MNYSESMSKRQQRRKALNQRFRRMFLVALLMGLAMGFIFGRCSAVNSKAPDAPIEPDQLTAVTLDVTLEPVEIPLFFSASSLIFSFCSSCAFSASSFFMPAVI